MRAAATPDTTSNPSMFIIIIMFSKLAAVAGDKEFSLIIITQMKPSGNFLKRMKSFKALQHY